MENVVMATLAGLPMADTAAAAASPVAGAEDGGQFGALVDAELALLTGEGKGGKKSAAGQANDSLAAMLLASLIQCYAQDDTHDETAVNEEAGAAAVQAQPDVAATFTADDIAKLIGIFQKNNSENGALARLLSGSRDAREALAALFSGSNEGSALNDLLETVSADAQEQFSELTEALQAAGTAANQNGRKALVEIRKLFSEIVSTMDEAAEDAAAQAQSNVTARGKLTKAFVGDILTRIDGLVETLESQQSETTIPVVTLTLGDEAASESTESQPEISVADTDTDALDTPVKTTGSKKEATDFTAALRAYRGEIGNAASAPRENSAAMALRQGEQAFDAIVDKISSMQVAGQKEMEIRLKPDFLGNVTIKLTMGDEGLTATIAASNPKVQDAFLSQASALQTTLAEQGLKDVRVVVTSSSVQDASLQQQLSQGRREARQDKQKRATAAIQAASFAPASLSQPLLAYEQAYRTGLVNRLA